MAVISEVPTEVLTEIFYLLCKKPIFVCELNNSRCKEDFPWAVGLVCRQWRTAFLSYPPIWASLTLFDSYYDSPVNHIQRRSTGRSGGHPLRLDISVWSSYNKPFTMVALEMLSACSHRWQTAKFDLSRDWALDNIHPCSGLPTLEWLKIRGTLTDLTLTINEDSVIKNGDIPNLLPMLHNIKELRFRFNYYIQLDSEGSFPQFAPTPLNKLQVLDAPHPGILSWFETPSLCEICFTDNHQKYHEPLDVRGQISSFIQRSNCRIRKLSFNSGRMFFVGTLNDVEELVIDYRHFHGVRPSIDISSLPKLRLLSIICSTDEDFESLMNSLTTVLKSARVPTRSKCSSGTSISLLERVTVELQEQPTKNS
ncbi:hypothetical protein M378DRAFT_171599 [Amanita muscaria Koide BX008]|uniref:F-box domain-containing protein n=1 Tax=Amanita muscaria (strain Koide BX008) TaxID=946122 RepID=A0A0C2WMZ8_AMAMK|nr:hypothetical protein M378DRAFT_171599 [Amanita muscaria Koide BX008]